MRTLPLRNKFRLVTGCIGRLALLILVFAVSSNATSAIDNAARNWAIGFNTPSLVNMWKGFSFIGSTGFLTVVTLACITALASQRRWQAALWLSCVGLGAIVLDITGKWLIHRPRPDEIYPGTMPASYSFPSGHAFYSLVLYSAIFATLRPQIRASSNLYFALLAVLLAVCIGTSRVFLGVHYVSDVLGGYLLAWIWLCVMREIQPASLRDP